MKHIQYISDNFLCSACGACYTVCPHDAISMKWTNIGRKYASVDTEKCVDCGLCQKVCPSIDSLSLHTKYEDPFIGHILNTYVGRSSDSTIFKNSQSGGVCSAILCHLFDTRKIDAAVLCKMAPGSIPSVNAILAESKEDVLLCQKSCYTPVDVLSALKQARNKKSIAVVGLPCHIEGAMHLQCFQKYKNIHYLLGLICDRTLCAGIMDTFATFTKENNYIINWRKKDFCYNGINYDYLHAPVAIVPIKEEKLRIIPNIYRFALKDMFTAPRCRVCSDKLNIHADIVLGDPWGMSDVDWQHGDSVVLTRTPIGQNIIEEMMARGKVNLDKKDNYNEVIKGQYIDLRRTQVDSYRKALAQFTSVNSYLVTEDIDKEILTPCINELQTFINNEKKSKYLIVKNALSHAKKVAFRHSLIGRVIRKMKNTINKTLKR